MLEHPESHTVLVARCGSENLYGLGNQQAIPKGASPQRLYATHPTA